VNSNKVKLKFLILSLLTLAASTSLASRVRRGWFEYEQPDGTTVLLEQRGDEWFNYYVTRDGVPVVVDEEKDMFCYADVLGFSVRSSGIMAHEQVLRSADESRHISSLSRLNETEAFSRAAVARKATVPPINTVWDSTKVYKSPVILLEYQDSAFSMKDPLAYYDSLFNCQGFNQGKGKGSVADYFREQSGGMMNLQFDVIGPFKIDVTYKYPNQNTVRDMLVDVIRSVSDSIDFSQYDWFGKGEVQQVLFVTAAFGRNSSPFGITPHTGYLPTTVTTAGGTKVSLYSVTNEKWYEKGVTVQRLSGIGTICHEFSHCLGLPDVYPVGGNETLFSINDEWDVMDGGNYTNWGWCPPNFSAHEKMLFGWVDPIELTDTISVRNMLPVSQGGEVYKVTNPGNKNEYYLLENRQWDGWDNCLPGQGLLVMHVDYKKSAWDNNTINSIKGQHHYEIIHASGMDYGDWDRQLPYDLEYTYTEENKVHCMFLSTSAYPAVVASGVNRELTDSSVPPASLFTANTVTGMYLMSKPITGIFQHDDGTVSFDFLGGTLTPASVQNVSVAEPRRSRSQQYYDLSGRPVGNPIEGRLYLHNSKVIVYHK
jgi:M6 family metalloprotease-like protein